MMRILKLLGAAALVAGAGLGSASPAEAQASGARVKGSKPVTVVAPAKGKRFSSTKPAPRVHFSRMPRVVG